MRVLGWAKHGDNWLLTVADFGVENPPADTNVLCVDEMGPFSGQVFPARRWSPTGKPPTFTPTYGQLQQTWVLGAFEPATGQALTSTTASRTQQKFIAFLDQLVETWTSGHAILIHDHLSVHKTLNVRLWALAHPQVAFLFQPTYSPWLNLIEPWWKPLKSLALLGRYFDTVETFRLAIADATAYWNAHAHPFYWRKAA